MTWTRRTGGCHRQGPSQTRCCNTAHGALTPADAALRARLAAASSARRSSRVPRSSAGNRRPNGSTTRRRVAASSSTRWSLRRSPDLAVRAGRHCPRRRRCLRPRRAKEFGSADNAVVTVRHRSGVLSSLYVTWTPATATSPSRSMAARARSPPISSARKPRRPSSSGRGQGRRLAVPDLVWAYGYGGEHSIRRWRPRSARRCRGRANVHDARDALALVLAAQKRSTATRSSNAERPHRCRRGCGGFWARRCICGVQDDCRASRSLRGVADGGRGRALASASASSAGRPTTPPRSARPTSMWSTS